MLKRLFARPKCYRAPIRGSGTRARLVPQLFTQKQAGCAAGPLSCRSAPPTCAVAPAAWLAQACKGKRCMLPSHAELRRWVVRPDVGCGGVQRATLFSHFFLSKSEMLPERTY